MIQGFTHAQDYIKLVGYGSGAAAYTESVSGGNTIIHLNTGATITLVGYTDFHASDVKTN